MLLIWLFIQLVICIPTFDHLLTGGFRCSGVAWAYSKQPEDIEIVTSWDAEFHHCSDVEKAPSQLLLGKKKGKTTWGFGVPADKNALKWFKLLLLDEKDLPIDVARSSQFCEAKKMGEELEKDPSELISFFLCHLWNHSIDSIERSLGKELLTLSKFHVVITTPVMWPPYAQQRMRSALELSGILTDRDAGPTTLRFVSEPEAAALATIKDMSKRSTIKVDDTIIICDAGGGTVVSESPFYRDANLGFRYLLPTPSKDLISYEIVSVQPFVIKECVKGEGELAFRHTVSLGTPILILVKAIYAVGSSWTKHSWSLSNGSFHTELGRASPMQSKRNFSTTTGRVVSSPNFKTNRELGWWIFLRAVRLNKSLTGHQHSGGSNALSP